MITTKDNILFLFVLFMIFVICFSFLYRSFIFDNNNELKILQVKCYTEKGVPFVKDTTNFFCAKDFIFIKKLGGDKDATSN